jgi:hypothetical protein
VRQLDAIDGRLLPSATKIRLSIAAALNKVNWLRSGDTEHPASKWLKWSVTGKVVAIEGDRTWHRDLAHPTRCADQGNEAR